MTNDLKFPISLERILYCTHCQRFTDHASVIYPDTEYNTCLVEGCGHKSTLHYDRGVAIMYTDVDKTELDGIRQDLNFLAGEITNRNFGKLGKKDADFITQLREKILAIARRVRRLEEKNDPT